MNSHKDLQWLEEILDQHAEYYIRETIKFFQRNGISPALSKNNEGDLAAKTAINNKLEQSNHIVDYNIDVRHEPDAIKAFNKFIKKWCPDYSHLIDGDDNDGEFMRQKIRQETLRGRISNPENCITKMEIWRVTDNGTYGSLVDELQQLKALSEISE